MFPNRSQAKPKFKLRRTPPPPNYNQRSVKLRVFALVAVVMAVLFVFEESRKKDPWKWFWLTPVKEVDLKNRLEPKPSLTANDPPGTIVQTSTQADDAGSDVAEADPGAKLSAEELAWRQGWKEIFVLFDPTERSLLQEILAQGRGEHQLGPEALAQASKLVVKLDENWIHYSQTAFQSLAELKPEERESWEGILRAVNERWLKQTQPALEAAAQGLSVPSEQRTGLDSFQHTLDQLNLNLVRDDSPLRPNENDLWFRLMNKARQIAPEELAAQSQKGVTYLQLFKQSGHYRGDLVTVQGTVRGAWKTPAVSNPWGIKEYYVLWIHPSGGPNAPIIVHLQELPAGFPKISERPADGKLPKLHEDVTVHGFFFKRQAYLGADSTYTAPLILARSLVWDSEIAKASAGTRWEFSWQSLMWLAAGTLSVSLIAAGLIYWRIREQDRHHVHDETVARADMSVLKDVEITPSVAEGLKQLEQEHGRKD